MRALGLLYSKSLLFGNQAYSRPISVTLPKAVIFFLLLMSSVASSEPHKFREALNYLTDPHHYLTEEDVENYLRNELEGSQFDQFIDWIPKNELEFLPVSIWKGLIAVSFNPSLFRLQNGEFQTLKKMLPGEFFSQLEKPLVEHQLAIELEDINVSYGLNASFRRMTYGLGIRSFSSLYPSLKEKLIYGLALAGTGAVNYFYPSLLTRVPLFFTIISGAWPAFAFHTSNLISYLQRLHDARKLRKLTRYADTHDVALSPAIRGLIRRANSGYIFLPPPFKVGETLTTLDLLSAHFSPIRHYLSRHQEAFEPVETTSSPRILRTSTTSVVRTDPVSGAKTLHLSEPLYKVFAHSDLSDEKQLHKFTEAHSDGIWIKFPEIDPDVTYYFNGDEHKIFPTSDTSVEVWSEPWSTHAKLIKVVPQSRIPGAAVSLSEIKTQLNPNEPHGVFEICFRALKSLIK